METKQTLVTIQPIKTKFLTVQIQSVSGSTLISHKLNAETVSKFMAREEGKAKKKEVRDYDKEYESCFYMTEKKKPGFPASAFMGAILDAATALDGIHKTQIKRAIRVLGDIYEITINTRNLFMNQRHNNLRIIIHNNNIFLYISKYLSNTGSRNKTLENQGYFKLKKASVYRLVLFF